MTDPDDLNPTGDPQPWLRLDARMLLVHPVTEAVRSLPVLFASVVIGTQSGNHLWGLIALVVIVTLAMLRWFTTTYRIGPTNIELKTGLFQRKLLSIPRSRIRSVDVEANLMHRLLGLSVVRIGTGTGKGDEKFELNALAKDHIAGLRTELLNKRQIDESGSAGGEARTEAGVEIAHFAESWVRFAPFSSTGVVAIAATIGVLMQYGLGRLVANSQFISGLAHPTTVAGIAGVVVTSLILLLLVASIFACVRYLLVYGGLKVVDDGRVLHVSHGLVKTRQTSLDRARLRGTTLISPLLVRLVGGARVDAIMTGISARKRESSLVLPLAPAREAQRVIVDLTGENGLAATALNSHGRAAARRRGTRALLPVAAIGIVLGVLRGFGVLVPTIVWACVGIAAVVALGLAWDRYRALGHATPSGWLVTQHGSLDRRRHSIAAPGIIGWTVRQSFFQRRAGVCTIVAATAAGRHHYEVIDVPLEQAWSIVEAVRPGAGDKWAVRA